jgi:hypothetical protein
MADSDIVSLHLVIPFISMVATYQLIRPYLRMDLGMNVTSVIISISVYLLQNQTIVSKK